MDLADALKHTQDHYGVSPVTAVLRRAGAACARVSSEEKYTLLPSLTAESEFRAMPPALDSPVTMKSVVARGTTGLTQVACGARVSQTNSGG